jgi:hypothetical protein
VDRVGAVSATPSPFIEMTELALFTRFVMVS